MNLGIGTRTKYDYAKAKERALELHGSGIKNPKKISSILFKEDLAYKTSKLGARKKLSHSSIRMMFLNTKKPCVAKEKVETKIETKAPAMYTVEIQGPEEELKAKILFLLNLHSLNDEGKLNSIKEIVS